MSGFAPTRPHSQGPEAFERFRGPATGQAWLAGFGLTARLSYNKESVGPPTGNHGNAGIDSCRADRADESSVDTRSDLYSLAVTVYQMIEGRCPSRPPSRWRRSTATIWLCCGSRTPQVVLGVVQGDQIDGSPLITACASSNFRFSLPASRLAARRLRSCPMRIRRTGNPQIAIKWAWF